MYMYVHVHGDEQQSIVYSILHLPIRLVWVVLLAILKLSSIIESILTCTCTCNIKLNWVDMSFKLIIACTPIAMVVRIKIAKFKLGKYQLMVNLMLTG